MKAIYNSINHFFERSKTLAPLFIRLLIGFHLIYLMKDVIFDQKIMQEIVTYFQTLKIPNASFITPLTVYSEFICGCLFILGAFTRIAAIIMVIVFVCAIMFAHLGDKYLTAFPAIVMLACSLFLLFNGAGKISVDHYLLKHEL